MPWLFWEQLGEAKSKCLHIETTPIPPSVSNRLSSLYLAKGALATTAIEGNTLNEEQSLEAVEGQLELPMSQEYQGREIENIVAACNLISVEVFDKGEFTILPEGLAELNRQVLDGLELEEGVVPGEIREDNVVVGNVYRGAPAGDCEFLVERLCEWLNGEDFARCDDRRETFLRAFLRAVLAHIYIAWIHPFGDGNGRTARLVEFGILTAAGVPAISAQLLSNHYNATRDAYYRQLNQASRSGGDLSPFLCYAIEGFVDGLERQLDEVRQVNYQSAWREYVDELFAGPSTTAKRRRRELVLALPTKESTPRSGITRLTPELAALYADKGAKTVTRDLNAIEEMGLIERSADGVRARSEVMLGFLPPAVAEDEVPAEVKNEGN
jgi:cell filamentation protein, protein adenylyltransferase